jgi:hypothetical protein
MTASSRLQAERLRLPGCTAVRAPAGPASSPAGRSGPAPATMPRRRRPQQQELPPRRALGSEDLLQSPSRVLRLERRVTLGSPLWRARWALLLVACAYIVKGARDLLGADRAHWTVPFVNNRRLLLGHFCCAAPFMLAVAAQKWLLVWVGEAPVERARYHRALGRFAVLCGALAAASALALAPRALAGTWVVFAPWSLLWLLASVMTLVCARRRDWVAHRWWANLLSQSGLLFVTGRLAIGLCLFLGLPSGATYYWSMVLAGGAGMLRFSWDLRAWQAERRKAWAWSHFRAVGRAAVLLAGGGTSRGALT